MIPFNIPPVIGTELKYLQQAIDGRKISGDGFFTKRCQDWMEDRFSAQKVLLTTSGTAALEMAAILCEIEPGDEVILPSYTFPTTATSFANLGAKLVFIDIRPDTMNIDEALIERAITDKTKVIVAVHYAGVSCEMDVIMDVARRHGLLVVEDAAQAFMATYSDRPLGTIGDFGCFSFHETKNLSMGEGGALVVNDERFIDRAEIIWEKGTNRSRFFRGQVDKYTWVDKGSSYLPSELNAAYLWAQLEAADEIYSNRMLSWKRYDEAFATLAAEGRIETPCIPPECVHNAHMYYLKLRDIRDRTSFIEYMKHRDVLCVFHYVPLHSSPAGERFGVFFGEDRFTTAESDKLVRLPLFYGFSAEDQGAVIRAALDYFARG